MLSGPKPFAFILCNFTDSPTPQPFSVTDVEIAVGRMNQFWIDNSAGAISLIGSQVFDWTTIQSTNAAFGQANTTRAAMITAARAAVAIDYSPFTSVIVLFSEPVGQAWAAYGYGAIFDPTNNRAAYICHETAHLLGELWHSFDFSGRKGAQWSQPGEYYDQTDIMSARNCWTTPFVTGDGFSGDGPNFCMPWKDRWGWIAPAAMRTISPEEAAVAFRETITLTSRSRPAGPGYLCATVANVYVELATPEGWDAGLPGGGVIIHQNLPITIGNDHGIVPYVCVPDLAELPDSKFWLAGSVYALATPQVDGFPTVYINILSIDFTAKTALIDISNVYKFYPPVGDRLPVVAIRKFHSTAGGGFDYIEYIGVYDSAYNFQSIVRDDAVAWITSGRNSFFVLGSDGSMATVMADGYFLRTEPDGDRADNLLSLPSF